MKDTSPRVPQKFLLVAPLILVGVCAAPATAARPKAQSVFAAAPLPPPPPQADKSPDVFMRVTVMQGEVWRGPIVLTSVCLPHRISVRSSARFLRFQQPTDSVTVGQNMPLRLSAVIDAAGLNPKVHVVELSLKCHDCKSVNCTHTTSKLRVEVVVVKPSTTPAAELEELSRNGPSVPAVLAADDFRFRALFRLGWALDLVFELARPGAVTLTVTPDGHATPLVYNVRGLSAGAHTISFSLPKASELQRPAVTGAANYSIKAVTDGPADEDVEPFVLISLAAGEPSAARSDDFAPPRDARPGAAAYGFAPARRRAGVPLGVEAVTFAPRDIRVVGDRPSASAAYSFRATLPFNGGAGAEVRLFKGGSSTLVSRRSVERLEAGQTVSGDWDCMKEGAPSLGRHRLLVRAWYTVQKGGNFSFAHSAESVVVRR